MDTPAVIIYTSAWCGYCVRAKALLEARGIPYREIEVDGNRTLREEMVSRCGRRTVPQIFIVAHHLGGSEELAAAASSGELDRLLGIGATAAPTGLTTQVTQENEDSHG